MHRGCSQRTSREEQEESTSIVLQHGDAASENLSSHAQSSAGKHLRSRRTYDWRADGSVYNQDTQSFTCYLLMVFNNFNTQHSPKIKYHILVSWEETTRCKRGQSIKGHILPLREIHNHTQVFVYCEKFKFHIKFNPRKKRDLYWIYTYSQELGCLVVPSIYHFSPSYHSWVTLIS